MPTPINIQGSGTQSNANTVMIDGNNMLWIAGSISSMPAVSVSVGSVLNYEVSPNDTSQNNPLFTYKYIISGTSTGVTGSEIGSIIQFIGAGSFVQVFTWSNDLIINVGSWI